MPSLVLLTDDAAYDLEEIHDYIARHDSIGRANHVLERIEKVFASLSEGTYIHNLTNERTVRSLRHSVRCRVTPSANPTYQGATGPM